MAVNSIHISKEDAMKKGLIITVVLVLSTLLLAVVGYAYSYGIYYASYADQDTAFVIMNGNPGNAYRRCGDVHR